MTQYRQKVCFKLCLQHYIQTFCNCTESTLPDIYATSKICATMSSLQCVSDKRTQFFESDSEAKRCVVSCPLECNSISYAKSISNSRYPTTYNTNYMITHTNISYKLKISGSNTGNIPKQTLAVNIFYDGMKLLFAISSIFEVINF